jgi:hypothetical protein
MEGRCHRHQFDSAVDRCQMCGHGFCITCLVYPKGHRKPPYCLPCAVNAAGVRNGSGSGKKISRRERRALAKERKEADAGAVVARAEAAADDTEWMTKVS